MEALSGYRAMWVVVMFDLPTDSADARRNYTRFRKSMMRDGFAQLQYSVYTRHCASEENAQAHVQRVEHALPPDGEVRIVMLTDKQFERMKVFFGKLRKPTEEPPKQLEFF